MKLKKNTAPSGFLKRLPFAVVKKLQGKGVLVNLSNKKKVVIGLVLAGSLIFNEGKAADLKGVEADLETSLIISDLLKLGQIEIENGTGRLKLKSSIYEILKINQVIQSPSIEDKVETDGCHGTGGGMTGS